MTPLSGREMEVARLVAEDLTDKLIGDILGISVRTVQEYLDRIARKLKVGPSPEGRREAIRHIVRAEDESRAAGEAEFAAIWRKYVKDGRPVPQPRPLWLYVIRRADIREVKIGVSEDPIARLKALQTAHGDDLELVATAPANMFTESEMHARFAEYRKKREWFHEAPAVTRWIDSLKRSEKKAS